MLDRDQPLAIFMEGHVQSDYGKMGHGVMRYSRNPIACVIDTTFAGKNINEVGPIDKKIPIVASIQAARQLGAKVLLLGIAPPGGKIPDSWIPPLEFAISMGMNIVNGLHDLMQDRFRHLLCNSNQWIWDIRVPDFEPAIGSAKAKSLQNKRLLTVGTDMAVGKMTAGFELYHWALEQAIKTDFIATGQIGISITGQGIPLDAFKVDHACGAVESMVMKAADKELIIVEGQGSLLHPGSTATLPLMRGACPTHLLLCHRAGMKVLNTARNIQVPPLGEFIQLNEDMASVCGAMTRAKCIGVALNTVDLDARAAERAVLSLEDELGLPVTDVLRFGVGKLGRALI